MNRLRAAWNGLTGKSANSVDLSQLGDLFGRDSASSIKVDRNTAVGVTALFCGLRVIGEGLAQMPLTVREQQGQRRVERPDHPAARLIARPNEWQSRHEFIETMAMICALDGNFFAIKNKSDNDRTLELLPLPPGVTSVTREGYNLIYTVGDGDRSVGRFQQSEILHLRGPGLDTYTGISPIHAAREALGLSVALERQQAKLAGNGGRPSGILYSDMPQSVDNARTVRDRWNAAFGAGGRGGAAVLDLGWKFQSVAATAVESQSIEQRQHQILEVARALRIFPQMLMAEAKGGTFASAEQFFRGHVMHTLGPWMSRIEGALNRDLLRGAPGLAFDFDERRMLRGDFKDQATFFATMLGAGGVSPAMTQNEVRQQLGLDPVEAPGADDLAPRLGSEGA